MQGKYKVITLCGSVRFKDVFVREEKRLTLAGNIVLSVALLDNDDYFWKKMSKTEHLKTRDMLADMHKRKIDMADEIFVINVGGYIGETTQTEIDYALLNGKIVNYLEEIA